LSDVKESNAWLAANGVRLQDFALLLLGKRRPGSAGEIVARGTSGLVVSRFFYSGVMFVLSILLARILGRTGYGLYTYAFAWVVLLGIPAILGADQLLIRQISTCRAREAWDLMKGYVQRANRYVLLASVAIALGAALIAPTLARHAAREGLWVFWVSLILIPLIALTRVRQGALQGLNVLVLGQLPEKIIQPSLFLIFVVAVVYGHFSALHLTAVTAMAMNVVATLIAFLVGVQLLHKYLPKLTGNMQSADAERSWMRSGLLLTFLSGITVIYGQADILILGSIKGAAAVGVYGVVDRGSELIGFLFTAAVSALAPTIASLYAAGDLGALQRLVTKLVRVTLGLTLPLAIVFIGFGYWVLLIVYGREFVAGQHALAILTLGQLFNVTMGPVGMLLVMTGREMDAITGIGLSAIANIVLSFALVPKFGLEGAAISATISTVIWNCVLAQKVHQRLGIHASVLGKLSFGNATNS
jgi:O-antigen/teichoic acid export membrane protein